MERVVVLNVAPPPEQRPALNAAASRPFRQRPPAASALDGQVWARAAQTPLAAASPLQLRAPELGALPPQRARAPELAALPSLRARATAPAALAPQVRAAGSAVPAAPLLLARGMEPAPALFGRPRLAAALLIRPGGLRRAMTRVSTALQLPADRRAAALSAPAVEPTGAMP
jgi:hypothetical protein